MNKSWRETAFKLLNLECSFGHFRHFKEEQSADPLYFSPLNPPYLSPPFLWYTCWQPGNCLQGIIPLGTQKKHWQSDNIDLDKHFSTFFLFWHPESMRKFVQHTEVNRASFSQAPRPAHPPPEVLLRHLRPVSTHNGWEALVQKQKHVLWIQNNRYSIFKIFFTPSK